MELFVSFFSSLQLSQWLALALAVILPTALFKRMQVTTGSAIAFAPARLPGVQTAYTRGRGRRQGGFTLIELLICMAILCILALVVGTVVYFAFFSGKVHISFS